VDPYLFSQSTAVPSEPMLVAKAQGVCLTCSERVGRLVVICGGFKRMGRYTVCIFCGSAVSTVLNTRHIRAPLTVADSRQVENQKSPIAGDLYCRDCKVWVPKKEQVRCGESGKRFRHAGECGTILWFGPKRRSRRGGQIYDSQPKAILSPPKIRK
jgi:hypothetical protein